MIFSENDKIYFYISSGAPWEHLLMRIQGVRQKVHFNWIFSAIPTKYSIKGRYFFSNY